jgi:CheY-like chemotaxis protein
VPTLDLRIVRKYPRIGQYIAGLEAVDLLRRHADQISLVLLDLTMPVMGGVEALRHFRSIREDVPVLPSSGFNESDAVHRFAGKGPAGFVQKPYTGAQLAGKVQDVLARTSSHKPKLASGMQG